MTVNLIPKKKKAHRPHRLAAGQCVNKMKDIHDLYESFLFLICSIFLFLFCAKILFKIQSAIQKVDLMVINSLNQINIQKKEAKLIVLIPEIIYKNFTKEERNY